MKRLAINAFFLILFLVLFFVVREEGDSLLDKHAIAFYMMILLSSLGNIKRKVIAKSRMPIARQVKSENFKKEFVASTEGATLLIVFGGLFLFLFIVLLVSSMTNAVIVPILFLTILSLGLLVGGTYQSNHPAKLIISHNGVEFASSLLKYKCGWEDIKEISSFMDGTNAIILRRATYRKNLWTFLYFDHKIQLSVFDRHWKRGEIGKLIKQNALQLEFQKS